MSAESVVQAAEDAYEAIRAINHATITTAHPAPVVYEVLGNLKSLGLAQAISQLALGLERSLSLYSVREDDGSDPAVNVAGAVHYLDLASQHASAMCAYLGSAQTAINGQGYDELPETGEVGR